MQRRAIESLCRAEGLEQPGPKFTVSQSESSGLICNNGSNVSIRSEMAAAGFKMEGKLEPEAG